MKRNLNSGITGAAFGLFIAVVYAVLQAVNGSFEAKQTILTAVLTGAVAGLLFGKYIRGFEKRQAEEFASVRERLRSEGEVFLDGAANHLHDGEYTGGWLFLTDEGLYFMSNPMNMAGHSMKIPYGRMENVRLMKQMGFVNGIVVETPNGSEYISVSKPKMWLEAMEERIKNS